MSEKVAVIMGSDSDPDTMRPCIQRLKSFGISAKIHIISAYRIPVAAECFASQVRENGFGAIIAAAGKAVHLVGVLAVYATLPVIGMPTKTPMVGGLDVLLSMVQIPRGIPAACVAVDGADNAAILFAQMLALSDEALNSRLVQFKTGMATEVEAKDHKIQMEEF